jgi:hypothetical protein
MSIDSFTARRAVTHYTANKNMPEREGHRTDGAQGRDKKVQTYRFISRFTKDKMSPRKKALKVNALKTIWPPVPSQATAPPIDGVVQAQLWSAESPRE